MGRHFLVATTSALLLLGGTSATGLAQPAPSVSGQGPISAPRIGAAAVAGSYFTRLNTAMRTGNIAPLAALFASGATLTEHASLTPNGSPFATRVVHGVPAIRAVFRAQSRVTPRLHWTFDRMTRLPREMVIFYAHTAPAPKQRTSMRSWQRFVIRDGAIVSLETSIYSLPY